MSVRITVKRDSGYADSLRQYDILIDDVVSQHVSNGRAAILEVPEGQHTIQCKIDWMLTEKIPFNAQPQNDYVFEGRNSLRGWRIALLPIYMTVLAKKYITLTRIK
jgi:hypothetical protein